MPHRPRSQWNGFHERLTQIASAANVRLEPPEEPRYRRIAICGHVNAGKSSFVNALVDDHISTVRAKATSALPIFIRYGKAKAAFVMDDGHQKGVGDGVAQSHTFDDQIDPGWSGLIWDLPRPFLRPNRYRLIDTPGLGDVQVDRKKVDRKTVSLLRDACEFRLVLFNKIDGDMLAPIKKLAGFPLLAVRTQADNLEETLADYLGERKTTLRELEKRADGLPVPFVYTSVKHDCATFGSIHVPSLAERLDIVFVYRSLFMRSKALLDRLEDEQIELAKDEAVLTAEEAARVYAGWHEVKKELDRIKRRRESTIADKDAELLHHLVSIPVGQAAWGRIVAFYGLPPVNIGQDPNRQYRALEKWFLTIEKRTTLERRLRDLAHRSAAARRDVKILLTLAAALLTQELGDPLSTQRLLEPLKALDGSALSTWRAYAPQLWGA